MTTPILTAANPPSPAPGTVLLETDRLILRRWTLGDAEGLSRAANYAEVAKNLSHKFPYPYTVETAHTVLDRWVAAASSSVSNYPSQIAICLKPSPRDNDADDDNDQTPPSLIGSMRLAPGEGIEYRTWTLGYFLTPPVWGKGYATEAVSSLIRWAFATWPTLNRIEAGMYSFNVGSERVLQKSGFLKEGVRRGATEKYGVVWDDVMYGVLRSDLEGK